MTTANVLLPLLIALSVAVNADNPAYEVVRAIVDVPIDDSDPGGPGQKWGRIETNGKAQLFIIVVNRVGAHVRYKKR